MNNSRRQRYFRVRSPNDNMDVLQQAELVMDGIPGEEQRVAHEEIVDDGNDSGMEHHGMRQQIQQQQQQQIHYDDRHHGQFAAPSQPRRVGRPNARMVPREYDMIQRLQNKNMYVSRATVPATSRISPGGARIVQLPRKRENDGQPAMKKMTMMNSTQYVPIRQSVHNQGSSRVMESSSQIKQQPQQQQHQGNPVKIVRLVTSSTRANPSAAEQAILEIEERIKQTTEEAKIDMEKVKELQEQEMSQDEYHATLGWLLGELDRLNAANNNLIDFHRQRQRNERSLYESKEDFYSARIRQLENENRKLREAMMVMYQTRIDNYDQNILRQQHEDHLDQIIEGEQDHVVIEQHDAKEEVPPEWIVEEAVDEMHMQEVDESVIEEDNKKMENHGQFAQNQ